MFGRLLTVEDKLVLAHGTSDHADAYAHCFDATKDANTTGVVREFAEDSIYLQCWPHIQMKVAQRAYPGDGDEEKGTNKLMFDSWITFLYYASR